MINSKKYFRSFPITLLMLVGVLGGCAWTPHQLELSATSPQKTKQKVGKGVKIKVDVIDDRDQRVVGQRGVGAIGSDISSPQLLNYFRRQVIQGFQSRGFLLISDKETADARVLVYLRSFKWVTEQGFFTGGHNVFVSIKAEAKNSKTNGEIVKTYQYDQEKRALFVASGGEINERMNAGLSDVLRQLFSDVELLRFLVATKI